MSVAMVRARLHLVTPPVSTGSDLPSQLEGAWEAGDIASVLLRLEAGSERAAKDLVKAIAPLVQRRGAALLVEDPRLAARVGADGVHLRRTDEVLSEALESLKPERIVGVGGNLSRDDAMRAGEAGVDYLMFGERADGSASPDRDATLAVVGWWAEIFNVPCIGFAANLDEVEDLAAAGAEFIGLAEAVWSDPRGPIAALREAEAAVSRAVARLAATIG